MPGKKPVLTFKAKREKFGITRDGRKILGPWNEISKNVKVRHLESSMALPEYKTFSQKKDIVIKTIKDALKHACKPEEKYVFLAKKMKANKATASAIAEEIDARFSIARSKKINPINTVKNSVIEQGSIAVSLKRAGFNHIEITKALKHITTSPLISVFILNDLLYTKVQIRDALNKVGYTEKDLELGLLALKQIK